MGKLTHLSLFSGIGGLDLAAEWAGIQTVGQCEWADYPAKVLEKHWPDVPRWKDIRTLTKRSFYERTGRRTVDIISGGFPCQPFSVAGKQRGREDDRYLWPEMVRVIKELRPSWVIGENVAGIVRMALPDILSELEACGYRTRAFLIPACAVGARHRRYRVAIVGHAEHNGLPSAAVAGSVAETGRGQPEREETPRKPEGAGGPGNCIAVGRTKYVENAGGSRFGGQENVCKQQGGAEPERPGKIMADAAGIIAGGLPFGEGQKKPGPCIGGENVQYPNCTGCKELHAAEKPDKEAFSGWGCDEGTKRPGVYVSGTDNGSGAVWRERQLSAVEETGGERNDIGRGTDKHEPGERRESESGMGGMADGIPGWMDGYWDIEPDIPRIASGIANRVGRLKALGNAVVPQQFYPFFKAISEVEN